MSAISKILTRLRAAIWAIDVRDDIANAIEQCYSDVSNPTLRTEALEAALQTKIDEGEMTALTIGDHTITAKKLAQGVIDNTLATSGAAADAKKVGDELAEINESLGSLSDLETESKTDLVSAINEAARSGLSDEMKEAILDCFRNVAWLDGTDGKESFDALLEAFGMSDFYNTWEWSYPGELMMCKATPSFLTGSQTDGILYNNAAQNQKTRRFPCVNRGKLKCVEYEEVPGDVYPIPIPKEATSVTVTIAPATMYLFLIRWVIQDGVYKLAGSKPWAQGTLTLSFEASSDAFLSINIKYDSSSNTEFITEPQGLEITFE